ncbi:KEOPS complex subunit Cgi121 [Salinirubrum litoreum]|uniref:KEOPS complex subunit Cgi121 n=1 Tax=Salinirubrum litoreum TaxID=1126234 RepID=A0ABD5RC93_9EURY|nr:KEOPS complex subunit Cgi121 [Salinirubrum litoreum]
MRVVEGIAEVDDLDTFLAALDRVATEYGCTIQAFDARYVVDRTHLRRALDLADRAIARGENVARDRAVEVLLYAAGRRQIDESLTMGVAEGETPVVVVVADDPETGADVWSGADDDAAEAAAVAVAALLTPAETLGDYDESRVRSFFEVGDHELAATGATLAELVHERVALLDVSK